MVDQDAPTKLIDVNGDKRPLDWKAAVVAIVVATAANGSIPYFAPSWGRPEPFRASEAQGLRNEMRADILREVRLMLAEQERLRSIEAWVMLRDPAYRPPKENFNGRRQYHR